MQGSEWARSQCSKNPVLVGQPARPLGRNYTRIDADPVQAAEQPAVLDLDAAVHDRFQPRGARLGRGRFVARPELLPEDPGADRNRGLRNWHHVLRLPEYIDDIDVLRDLLQG